MSKKFLISVFVVAFAIQSAMATNFYNPQDRSFKAGFEAGLKALEFQRKNEGVQPKEMVLNDSYYLMVDTKNMPMSEVLFLENITAREGFEPLLTKNYLVFTGYERKADALDAQSVLENKFKIKTTLKSGKGQTTLITYPVLWGEFYTNFLNEISSRGYAIEVQVIEVPKIVYVKEKTSSKKDEIIKDVKGQIVNDKAMSYKLEGSNNLSGSFKEEGLVERSELMLDSPKSIATVQGEKFYKVRGKNLYFNTKDIRIIK